MVHTALIMLLTPFRWAMALHGVGRGGTGMRDEVHGHQHQQGDDELQRLPYTQGVPHLHAQQLRPQILQLVHRAVWIEAVYPFQDRGMCIMFYN